MKASRRLCWLVSVSSVLGLILLGVSWELWLAPLRPGGSWLVLKVLPLLAALRGLLHARTYTFQWVSMLSLAYFTEGTVRAWSDTGLSAQLGALELALALALFAGAILFIRTGAPQSQAAVRPAD